MAISVNVEFARAADTVNIRVPKFAHQDGGENLFAALAIVMKIVALNRHATRTMAPVCAR